MSMSGMAHVVFGSLPFRVLKVKRIKHQAKRRIMTDTSTPTLSPFRLDSVPVTHPVEPPMGSSTREPTPFEVPVPTMRPTVVHGGSDSPVGGSSFDPSFDPSVLIIVTLGGLFAVLVLSLLMIVFRKRLYKYPTTMKRDMSTRRNPSSIAKRRSRPRSFVQSESKLSSKKEVMLDRISMECGSVAGNESENEGARFAQQKKKLPLTFRSTSASALTAAATFPSDYLTPFEVDSVGEGEEEEGKEADGCLDKITLASIELGFSTSAPEKRNVRALSNIRATGEPNALYLAASKNKKRKKSIFRPSTEFLERSRKKMREKTWPGRVQQGSPQHFTLHDSEL